MQFAIYAVGIFVVAALGGLFMAHRIMNGNLAPWFVSFVHLGLGVAGLVLTFLAVTAGVGGTMGFVALGVLAAAAVGGLVLLLPMHLRKKLAPNWTIIVHACVGGLGVLLLLLVAFVLNIDPNLADGVAVAPNLR